MTNIRIFFSKKGRAKYISHLDMYRLFMRCFKKTTIPIWYTEGFNPHMYMTFPMPLSLGTESDRECVDIKLTEEMPISELKLQLTGIFPEGIEVTDVAEPKKDQKEIAFADYEIEIYLQDGDAQKALESFRELCSREEILAQKKGKSHGRKVIKEVDIKPMFKLLDARAEEIDGEMALRLKLRCECSISKSLNPSLVVGACFSDEEIRLIRINRRAILTDKLEEFA